MTKKSVVKNAVNIMGLRFAAMILLIGLVEDIICIFHNAVCRYTHVTEITKFDYCRLKERAFCVFPLPIADKKGYAWSIMFVTSLFFFLPKP